MTSITISLICQNEECEADIDVEGNVTIESQRHSFWGQPVSEDISEVEILTHECDLCGTAIDETEADEKLYEAALEY